MALTAVFVEARESPGSDPVDDAGDTGCSDGNFGVCTGDRDTGGGGCAGGARDDGSGCCTGDEDDGAVDDRSDEGGRGGNDRAVVSSTVREAEVSPFPVAGRKG